jgi:hypothetical protein
MGRTGHATSSDLRRHPPRRLFWLPQSQRPTVCRSRRLQHLYAALDDIRRACLLNIAAKTRMTPLSNGKVVLGYLEVVRELRGDRFFATVPRELREETKNSVAAGLFHVADETLHHPPDSYPGFTNAGSFRTNDSHGQPATELLHERR